MDVPVVGAQPRSLEIQGAYYFYPWMKISSIHTSERKYAG